MRPIDVDQVAGLSDQLAGLHEIINSKADVHPLTDFLLKSGGSLTGALAGTSATFSGAVTALKFTGVASAAEKLVTPRLINGKSFDGTTNVNLDAAALGFTTRLEQNGFEWSPTGQLTQWGLATSSGRASGNLVITLPTPFKNACLAVTALAVGDTGDLSALLTSWSTTTLWLTTLKSGVRTSGVTVSWTAVGW